jgi:Skp family chaperone for outer membrane proteins
MPQSKKRKGHNKKIQTRNTEMKSMQKKFQQEMSLKMEQLRKQFQEQSGTTQNPENNEMGLIQSNTGL